MSTIPHIDLLKLARRTPLLHTLHEQKRISATSPKFIWIFMDIQEFLEGDDWAKNGGEKCEMIGYRYFIE